MSDRDLPPIQTYNARDGRSLCYRLYPADSNKIIILLHGISKDGLYLRPLAEFVSTKGLAQVVVPDLRGYGMHPIRRGDVEYIGQYDDDIEDLTKWLRSSCSSGVKLIIAGHSGGGANAIRLAVHRKLAKDIGGFLLLAPSIHPDAPINHKKDPWSTIQIDSRKIAFLTVLNALGIRFFNHLIVLRNDIPMERRSGRETLAVSYRLLMSRITKTKYERYLQAMTQPTLVLVGEKEEVFIPGQYAPLFAELTQAKVATILDADHDGILSNRATFEEVESWLTGL